MQSSTTTPLQLKQFELRNIIHFVEESKNNEEKRKKQWSMAKTQNDRQILEKRHNKERSAERTKIEHLKQEYEMVQKYMNDQANLKGGILTTIDNSDSNDSSYDPNAVVKFRIPSSSSSGRCTGSRFDGITTVSDLHFQREMNLKFDRSFAKSEIKQKQAQTASNSLSERKQLNLLQEKREVLHRLIDLHQSEVTHRYQFQQDQLSERNQHNISYSSSSRGRTQIGGKAGGSRSMYNGSDRSGYSSRPGSVASMATFATSSPSTTRQPPHRITALHNIPHLKLS